MIHADVAPIHASIQSGIDERYIVCIAVKGNEVVDAFFLDHIHRSLKHFRLFIVVLSQELSYPDAAFCLRQKTHKDDLAARAVKPCSFYIQHTWLHAAEIFIPNRMVFAGDTVFSGTGTIGGRTIAVLLHSTSATVTVIYGIPD